MRSIVDGSAAAAAGVRVGMQLLTISSVRAASLSVREVQRRTLRASPDVPVELQLVPATADVTHCGGLSADEPGREAAAEQTLQTNSSRAKPKRRRKRKRRKSV